MGFLDIFKKPNASRRFDSLFQDLFNEARSKKPDTYTDPSYHHLANLKEAQKLGSDDTRDFLLFILDQAREDWQKKKQFDRNGIWYHSLRIADHLLKHVDLETATMEKIAGAFAEIRKLKSALYYVPYITFLHAMQRSVRKYGYTPSTKSVLKTLLHDRTGYIGVDERKENDLILFLLQENASFEIAEHDQWGPMVITYLKSCDQETCAAWVTLFGHAKVGAGKSTPAAKWLKEAEGLLQKVGHEVYATQMIKWLQHLQGMLQDAHKAEHNNFLREENHEIVKGLIWCAGMVNDPSLHSTLEDYAVWAYKKKAGVGSLSVKTGTAAMFAFSTLPVKEGVARLSKFKTKIKNNSILKSIDKILRTLSEKKGLSISAMEELAVPDFGIVNGEMNMVMENCIARYSFQAGEITWLRDGRAQKSVPVEIKDTFAAEIKAFKKTIKEAGQMLPVVKSRLEQSYLEQREWEFDTWYKLYMEHELVSIIAKDLVWHFSQGEQKCQGIFSAGRFVDSSGEAITWLTASTKVQLWHPIGFAPEKIVAWRNFLRAKKIVQPFKQAYREVYIVTDAELRTEVYSNRYAAHILRQHQFAALLKQRGWMYRIQGTWDSHNTPYLTLSKWNLTAEFLVNADWAEGEGVVNDMGIFNYITTDQVRFVNGLNAVPLQEVPAIVFSEVMRDVDLFVGVTSIGNDAAWQDGGDRLQDRYWREYSFRDLSESAKIRSQVLESLIPSLKIAPVCSFDKKFLIVKGKLKTYKIHMGSGNILMEPDDRYLCIVPESKNISKAGEKIFLPFEGDGILSIIISKALLLADDDKIKDVTITRQLKN